MVYINKQISQVPLESANLKCDFPILNFNVVICLPDLNYIRSKGTLTLPCEAVAQNVDVGYVNKGIEALPCNYIIHEYDL
jgi:hypothetical protein